MDRTEKWMHVEYAVKPIISPKLSAWQHAVPHSEIQLPPANPFVPESLQLVTDVKQTKPAIVVPSLIAEEEKAKIYFAIDKQYLVPEVGIRFNIKTPALDGSSQTAVFMDLFNKALAEKLSSTLFFARSAGISASFSYQNLKFTFAVQGFSEKAPDLVTEIFNSLATTDCSAEDFEIYKTSLLSAYMNASKELPVRQALDTLSSTLLNDAPTYAEKYKSLESLTHEEFLSFCKQWMQSVYVEGMIFGNMTTQEALSLWENMKPALSSSLPYLTKDQKKRNILLLPPKKGPYKIVQQTERQGHGAVLLIQEGPFSFSKKSSQLLLSKALQDSFFETLRTKQQTAYIAKSWDQEEERQLSQIFAVQSSTHNPDDLLMRFEMFLEDFHKRLVEVIPEERFQNLRKMQITSLQIPPENMAGMASRLSTLAFDYDADFSWIEKQIEALQALSYEDLLQDAHLFLSKENQRRVAILVEGVTPEEKQFQYETVAKDDLKKIGTFVSYN